MVIYRIQNLGKCADGEQWVRIEFVKKLVDMGYSFNLATAALKQANNKIYDAIQAVLHIPHILTAAFENPVILSEMIYHFSSFIYLLVTSKYYIYFFS